MTTRLLALCLGAATAAACSTDPTAPAATGGKADDGAATCDGAKPDDDGVCRRPNGQYAPKACCEVAPDPECFVLEDFMFDFCLPDDEEPVDWPTCFDQAKVTMVFASECCQADPERFLWCDQIPAAECFAFEDFAFDNCVPDDDAPVDWHTCIELSDITLEEARTCCDTRDFLWCEG